MTDDELKRLLEANAAEVRRHFDETADRLAAENRRYFDVAMESNKHEIGLIAEKVTQLDEKLQKIGQPRTRNRADGRGDALNRLQPG